MAQAEALFDSKTQKYNLPAIMRAAWKYVNSVAPAGSILRAASGVAYYLAKGLRLVWAEARQQREVYTAVPPKERSSTVVYLKERIKALECRTLRYNIADERREIEDQIAMLEAA